MILQLIFTIFLVIAMTVSCKKTESTTNQESAISFNNVNSSNSITPSSNTKITNPTINLNSNLIARWTFDTNSQNLLPEIISNYNGTNYGSVIINQNSIIANGYQLDGNTTYSKVPTNSAFNFLSNQNFTISIWVKDDKPTGTNTWANAFSIGNTRAGYCSGTTA